MVTDLCAGSTRTARLGDRLPPVLLGRRFGGRQQLATRLQLSARLALRRLVQWRPLALDCKTLAMLRNRRDSINEERIHLSQSSFAVRFFVALLSQRPSFVIARTYSENVTS